DLVIGSGRGGRLGVYENDGKGGFKRWEGAPFEKVLTRDQTGVVGTVGGLVVGSANYEDGLSNGGWVRIYDVGRKVSGESVLGQESSAGPVMAGDVEGRGQLDLFVGGRVKGGRYGGVLWWGGGGWGWGGVGSRPIRGFWRGWGGGGKAGSGWRGWVW